MLIPSFRTALRAAAFLTAALTLAACASSRSLDKSVADIGSDFELKGVLFADSSHDYSDVDLTVYEGRLMLTGSVRSDDARKKLIENAWKADNIREVIDEVFVGDRTPFGQGFEDSRIDQTLRTGLIADRDIRSGDYKIAVSGAVVYLLGAARSEAELQRVIARARSISGVEKVVSYIVLRPAAL